MHIARNEYETDLSYFKRRNFIISSDYNKKNNNIIKYSNIWVNMKLLGCRYSDDIEKKVLTIAKNMNKGK